MGLVDRSFVTEYAFVFYTDRSDGSGWRKDGERGGIKGIDRVKNGCKRVQELHTVRDGEGWVY